MKITTLKVGLLECNCYILNINDNILIIDPGDNYELINENIKNKTIIGILVTHNHDDHTGAIQTLKENYNIKVYNKNNLEEKEYQLGPFNFKVIYNPGHTNDSISFYFKKDNLMFVGDFIFKNSIGRCDLPTGNYQEMLKSIEKLKKIKENIILYPGHGDNTNLDYEKTNNMYF